MKVLHLNNPAQVASNLVSAQRKLGIDANLAITGNKHLHDNYDYDYRQRINYNSNRNEN